MAEVLEASGKTVEEAIALAASKLGVTTDLLDYKVIQQPSNGFFGLFGTKPARIEAMVKSQPACSKEPAGVTEAAEEPVSVGETVSIEEQAKIAEKFLQDVFQTMKLDVKIERGESEEGVLFQLIGKNLGILIGKHGQTLDSLQYLANLAANRGISENRARIIIDIENYRSRREDTLVRLAGHLAEKACRIGEEVHLEPMNRHERKIIHMALQDNRRVSTYSAGDEPRRYVVIAPKRRRRSRRNYSEPRFDEE
ncbi:MAG: protein jag [Selenomonas sp.]|uniref:RNA-binding cell elongation regulator Jag/EloR n=1 Tax=Selenomonas sp. TaxID=2053611 RepID=UPI0025FAD0FA|nr:RNA-binding cell elongation regulator Jag/EloR [Selenomonas sp.]MCR5439930.1 protein jag [Selenomonas sp.]